MITTATTAPAAAGTRRPRIRALVPAAASLAAALTWAVEVPGLGLHLNVRFGAGHVETIAVGQITGVAAGAALLGWLLLTLLERRSPRAGRRWTVIALAVLVLSLALPFAATTTAAVIGLIALHLAVGAAVIPFLARTARSR
jgi:hypothetical protein